ncbi:MULTISPECIES: zinc-binding alcohol dehydrogenase [unclassified Microbacterium]|uniref:zinc-binding alcohol dehydrogenase n=1 Tax=unclassified Microbacterium TaxID=2609290 RepID=UPI00214C1DE0|nr:MULTISPECIES: zinc-binding alcohol dehydrogenase [unclassified Microbacterium]MCR2784638.1 zinc-binding alcohol dehydrogenase [Microbacterium sp. zg.B96]MDL5353071.1 zinc-binding alcohol dehydrogenase [Microbacterium sp. zg-YB36]WIM16180.1 zinc-binding alcohol dehydrogenase [Microbacterium sp. zg-B96]
MVGGTPEWVVREDASQAVLAALGVRQLLGIRSPEELPTLRGLPAASTQRTEDQQAALERQWRSFWAMTVEPQAHPSPVPLDLVAGFGSLAALPTAGFEELRDAMMPHAQECVAYAQRAHERYGADAAAGARVSYRAYAGAIAEHERRVGRRAHSFELNVQVLPLAQRGVWWIGSLTIAVTDGLRGDVVAFDAAINPIIAELA